ncbi:GldL-related protein [Myroides pelagicus]|uniref:Gliding motility protein GldL-like N-terminal domain-containing protein n=1 Tax=Myroides pelagicus TaxID=270914 RepID=A0A7K1GPG4_9FLAO|nr:hypothetical protein [Myroides pelagicus]MEC4115278.1 hypothetical protein [Myroides pelagicus]MTH30792.1 hypothetical protein [Myroides pelagicus]
MKKILSIRPKPLGLLGIGAVVVFIGAIAKITKENFAGTLLLIGIVIEIIGIIYFLSTRQNH